MKYLRGSRSKPVPVCPLKGSSENRPAVQTTSAHVDSICYESSELIPRLQDTGSGFKRAGWGEKKCEKCAQKQDPYRQLSF